MFDPAKRQPVLNPMCQQVDTSSMTPSQATGGLAELSSLLMTVWQFVSPGIVSSDVATPIPVTPSKSRLPYVSISPAINTPSKLSHFLKYAEEKLGVSNATTYEAQLKCEGYGPDILHLVNDKSLTSLGFAAGDVLHLKAGCVTWWKGPDAKHKFSESDDPFQSRPTGGGSAITCTPLNKKVCFEKKFAEGGSHTFFGPHMIECDPDGPEPADKTWYYCEARQGMFPIPKGFMALGGKSFLVVITQYLHFGCSNTLLHTANSYKCHNVSMSALNYVAQCLEKTPSTSGGDIVTCTINRTNRQILPVLSEICFDCRKSLFNGIQIRQVGWKEDQFAF